MASDAPVRIIAGDNLSLVWGEVVAALAEPGVEEISPLVVSIGGFDEAGVARESSAIRSALDKLLPRLDQTEIVAFTIFPQEYWRMSAGDREEFFDLCRESFPRIQDFAPQRNARGLYFQRLVDFEGTGGGLNQLKEILDEYDARPATRRSKWQVTTFNPHIDLNASGQLGFPCLQQVSFTPVGDDGLVVNAFYATQQIVRKAYGNYLGICRLGAFVAQQMKRRLVRVNVFVGVAQMKERKKTGIVPQILRVVRDEVCEQNNHAVGSHTNGPRH